MIERLGDLGSDAARLGWSFVVIVVVLVVRRLTIRGVIRRLDDSQTIFRARKISVYLAAVALIGALTVIWVDEARSLATFFGVLSAGVVIALSDVLSNFAGWVYILLRSPFSVGDRIEIGEHAGDVIDIRVLRFSLLEIRNWVEADQTTGRILHVPNGQLFRLSMANFTQGFEQVWHEIEVVVTFESNWERARSIVQEALELHAAEVTPDEASASLRKASRQYFIRYGHLTPTVYVSGRPSGVALTGRVLVNARSRRTVDSALWTHILSEFGAAEDVEIAYQTTRWVAGGAQQLQVPHQEDA